ncbi:MAG TPA: glycosyltransferase family 87 protein, partial [Gemmataceae bacterium]|nr:glycosyltransferase family 87 protein [Gemmataceae bacterium]
DFFIYRIGAVIALKGETPYDVPKVRALVAEQYPDPEPKFDSFVNNCGYFPPPLALVLYAPYALLPWPAAKLLWAATTLFAAWAVTKLPGLFRRPGEPAPPVTGFWQFVPILLVLNTMTIAIVVVGQTTLVFIAAVAAGQLCFERKREVLGAFLWSIPFVKPHLALPLILLAWYLGGWRRAALVLGVVGALNLIGAAMIGSDPVTSLRAYFDYVPSAHKEVLYNRAELNPQIASWNRLWFAYTGNLVELTIVTTVAGYLVWFGLVAGRCALANEMPSPSWAACAAVAGGLLCCQVLGYELLLFTIAVPWLRDLWAAGYRQRVGLAILLIVFEFFVTPSIFTPIGLESARPLGVALFALLVLSGPVNPRR